MSTSRKERGSPYLHNELDVLINTAQVVKEATNFNSEA
jgi:hypothetical protein